MEKGIQTTNNMLPALPMYCKNLIGNILCKNVLEIKKNMLHLQSDYGKGYDLRKVLKQGTYILVLKKHMDPMDIAKVIAALLTDYCNSYNVVRNMSAQQIVDWAIEEVENLEHYTLEDYVVFFQQAKSGKFGQPFDRIDRGTVDSMFEQYHNERTAALRELIDARQHNNIPMERMTKKDAIDDKVLRLGDAINSVKNEWKNSEKK